MYILEHGQSMLLVQLPLLPVGVNGMEQLGSLNGNNWEIKSHTDELDHFIGGYQHQI